MIAILPEHLPKNVCSQLIQLFERNVELSQEWNCTNPIELFQIENDKDLALSKKVIDYISSTIR